MKRHILILLPVLFLIFIWGCQEDSGILSTGEEPVPEIESHGRFDFGDKTPKSEYEYEITLDNLCPVTGEKSSQPFSPPVFATHTRGFHMYRLYSFASPELEKIAEVGNGQPMADMLNGKHRVYDVVQGSGLILPGTSATFHINAKAGFNKLSFASMLGITNDGFTGFDAVSLPRSGSEVYYLHSYDAGTEKNTELEAHLGAFGNPDGGITTRQRIHRHHGIRGIGDLDPVVFGWDEPVAKLTIRVVN